MTRKSMYHAGHRTLQDRYDGRRVADALEKHRRLADFGPQERALIESAPFFFLATAHEGSVDCSFKGGAPGFVRVTGPDRLEWDDLDGNSMYRSLGNILGSGRAGLLFIRMDADPARLRVNGAADIAHGAGGRMTVRLRAEEIFPNCPRYIPDLPGARASRFTPDASGASPAPQWKSRDYIHDILPDGDPHK